MVGEIDDGIGLYSSPSRGHKHDRAGRKRDRRSRPRNDCSPDRPHLRLAGEGQANVAGSFGACAKRHGNEGTVGGKRLHGRFARTGLTDGRYLKELEGVCVERIELATPEGRVEATVANPAGRGPWPGVVIVHDMVSATSGGLPGIIDRVADAGHLAIAPNLYSRGGPIRCVTRVVRELRSLSGRAF